MEKKFKKGSKLRAFVKRNAYYLIMAVCIAAIGSMVTVALVTNNKNTADPADGNNIIDDPTDNPVIPDPTDPTDNPVIPDPNEPVVTDPIVFVTPVANSTIIKDYSMDALVYHKTINEYSVHAGINFGGASGAEVVAAYDGTVESVTEDLLNGKMIVIAHADGLRTSYSSLGSTTVTQGATVTKGQTIGTIGVSSTREMLEGEHVHFRVTLNNKIANPYDYLPSGNK